MVSTSSSNLFFFFTSQRAEPSLDLPELTARWVSAVKSYLLSQAASPNPVRTRRTYLIPAKV